MIVRQYNRALRNKRLAVLKQFVSAMQENDAFSQQMNGNNKTAN